MGVLQSWRRWFRKKGKTSSSPCIPSGTVSRLGGLPKRGIRARLSRRSGYLDRRAAEAGVEVVPVSSGRGSHRSESVENASGRIWPSSQKLRLWSAVFVSDLINGGLVLTSDDVQGSRFLSSFLSSFRKKRTAARRFRRAWTKMSRTSPSSSTARHRYCRRPLIETKSSSTCHVSPN